ncbi:MAG: DUF721 domain-containing protein [Gammaproteobacteria bacterium]|nr:DUF721 domain-containing protein [Gammaproteobacteria bacterium]
MKPLGSKLPSILKQRANWLLELNQHLYTVLPAEFHSHVQIAGLHRSLLTLEADSPVWAAKVRYQGNDLARQLSVKTGLTIKSVKLLIQPKKTIPEAVKRNPLTISSHSAHQFESLAKSIKHPDLKRSLLKLARRGDR